MPARRAPNAEEEGVMAHVAQLYRYPVKSMQGERVDRLEFTSGSAVGDRQLALADAETGVYLSAKRHGQVLEAFARTEADGSVVISLPHGVEIGASDPAANGVLSEWLGRHVELRVAGSDQAPSYESLADSTDDGSATVTFAGPTTHFADFADLHLLTTASLRAASALRREGDWDARRFRPTAVVEVEGEGYLEDDWIGSTVTIGRSAAFVVFMKTIRCNLPTRAQPGLPRDTAVARLLRDEHDFCLGVYGAFRQPGVVEVGDELGFQLVS
jgi:uncharacterized protein YcbX